ncbi:MAG: amidohydrolase family protein [Dehalococcoidales bacterium]|nr:MAG: amidohydrolase family protein [Dehalococcoidales bacterium]
MLVLTNFNLVDGTGHEPVRDSLIIIRNSRFEYVGAVTDYPAEARVIDLHNYTVMPGLIDCHLHLGGMTVDKPGKAIGKVSFPDMVSFTLDYVRNYSQRRRLAIENGITSIRSAGDLYPHIVKLRDKIAASKLTGPRIFTPGPTITAPGGHPASTIYKGNRYIAENAIRQIDSVEIGRAEVKRLAEGGVDCIKAIYSEINPMDTANKVPRLSLKVLEALADETHKHNLRIMVHTGSAGEVMEALQAGADSIEHGILPGGYPVEFNNELIKLMLDRGVYFVPTVAIAWAYKEMYPDFCANIKTLIKKVFDVGVPIAAVTDSGTPGVVIGKGLHKELELLVEAGLSPLEAIVAGTKKAAENIGQGHELGTIEPGKIADIIAISGNPLKNITDTREIKMVIKDGKVLVNTIHT